MWAATWAAATSRCCTRTPAWRGRSRWSRACAWAASWRRRRRCRAAAPPPRTSGAQGRWRDGRGSNAQVAAAATQGFLSPSRILARVVGAVGVTQVLCQVRGVGPGAAGERVPARRVVHGGRLALGHPGAAHRQGRIRPLAPGAWGRARGAPQVQQCSRVCRRGSGSAQRKLSPGVAVEYYADVLAPPCARVTTGVARCWSSWAGTTRA